MDDDRARELIAAKRAELQSLLADTQHAGEDDRASEKEQGDTVDPASGFEAEAVDDAVGEGIRQRLDALDRAEQRVAAGTYGQSVRSGDPIPDERLEVDPAAELTVDEAAADEA
jgi:DnaK suppressor protein